jgi:uncharacterized membrane protein
MICLLIRAPTEAAARSLARMNRQRERPSNRQGRSSEGAMLEVMITTVFAAFIAVAVLGHLMLFKAMLTPNR